MRLITRSDFDGLVCAMILKECGIIEKNIKFVHPKDIQDGKVEITDNDILTNLPYCKEAYLCFDHHMSELERNKDAKAATNWVIEANAKSAARVVYNYYKNRGYDLSRISEELMVAVDKGDSADFTENEILHPRDWVLLNFIMDARTGLGRFHNFKISNYDLMMELIDECIGKDINEIIHLPDLQDRINLYFSQSMNFKHQLDRITKIYGDVAVVDLRSEETIYAGNRFIVYAMFPQTRISIHVTWGYQRQNIAIMIGKSIFDKSSNVNIGQLCLKYGGGGHFNAGTCQVPIDKAEDIIKEIINECNTLEQLSPNYVKDEEDVLTNMYNYALQTLRDERANGNISETDYYRKLRDFNAYATKYGNVKINYTQDEAEEMEKLNNEKI